MNIFQPAHTQLIALLKDNNLPTADIGISATQYFLGCGELQNPDGVIGLEIHEDYGLLRSLAVRGNCRGQGIGRSLVDALEALAEENKLRALYLLTTTAPDFFVRLGYQVVARDAVAAPITRTAEFTSLCPDDAIVMCKPLPR